MSDQLSFSDAEQDTKRKKTRREVFLEETEKVVPWSALETVIEPLLLTRMLAKAGTVAPVQNEPMNTLINLSGDEVDSNLIGTSDLSFVSGERWDDSLSGGDHTLIRGADQDTLTGGAYNDNLTGEAGRVTCGLDGGTDAVTDFIWEICKKYNISEQTFFSWRNRFGSEHMLDTKRFKDSLNKA